MHFFIGKFHVAVKVLLADIWKNLINVILLRMLGRESRNLMLHW